jgi:hypothetical protein
MPLDADAFEKLLAAGTDVAKRRNRIEHAMSRWLDDCKAAVAAAVAAAAAEHERLCNAAQQNEAGAQTSDIKTESGCKRPKSEDKSDDGKAEEPEAKRIKAEAED